VLECVLAAVAVALLTVELRRGLAGLRLRGEASRRRHAQRHRGTGTAKGEHAGDW
jgi:hypothetical protein